MNEFIDQLIIYELIIGRLIIRLFERLRVVQSARIAGFRGKSTSLPSKGGSKQTDLKL